MVIATTNADGQPYIQYCGEPPGLLKNLDQRNEPPKGRNCDKMSLIAHGNA